MSSHHVFIGIDPGLKGGVAFLGANGEILESHIMPVVGNEIWLSKLACLLRTPNSLAYVEHSQAISKAGAGTVFKFGMGFGAILGILSANHKPYTLVKPRVWQKEMHAGTDPDLDPKQRSLISAERLYPTQNFLASERCKKPHDGMIDAVLIAEYGRRKFLKEPQK